MTRLCYVEREGFPQLLPVLKEFCLEHSPWDSFDENRVLQVADQTVYETDNLVLAAIEDDQIAGVLIAIKVQSLFSKDYQTQELAFYVKPEFRKSTTAKDLLSFYDKWSKHVADISCLVCIDDRVGKIYQRQGYTKAETAYYRRNR